MIDLPSSAFAQLFVLGSPYWILALAALATTGRARRRRDNGRAPLFRNRFAGWGVGLLVLAFAIVMATLFLSRFGNCSGGFIDEVVCAKWPDMIGKIIGDVRFLVTVTTSAIGFPAAGCYVLAEFITRARRRRAR